MHACLALQTSSLQARSRRKREILKVRQPYPSLIQERTFEITNGIRGKDSRHNFVGIVSCFDYPVRVPKGQDALLRESRTLGAER